MEDCLLKGKGGGNIRRQILLRSSKVICQQALNRLYQPGYQPSLLCMSSFEVTLYNDL